MSAYRTFRPALLLAIVCCLVLSLSAPVFAEDAAAPEPIAPISAAPSPDGVYAVIGTTNTGKQVATNVLVTSTGERIQFQARVMGIPLTTSGPATWNPEHTEVTVPITVYVFGLADASGSITLIATEGGWSFFGAGDGQVLRKKGSATAEGFMPGGEAPTPELINEATGVSEGAQAIDDATGVLQPVDAVSAVETGDVMGELAAILVALFIIIFLELVLGMLAL